jgi:glucose/mannose transport system substrate-binding protein
MLTRRHPNVEVVNATVTGGSGVNAKAVLKTRMLGGEPPDSFQVHAGQELIGTWVEGRPDGRPDLSVQGKGLDGRFPRAWSN